MMNNGYVDWNRVQEMQDEMGAELGDPRRCAIHGEVTSSPCGQFDAPCGRCEAEMDDYGEELAALDRPPVVLVEAPRRVLGAGPDYDLPF